MDRPVMLPPGRARLATRPVPTGSPAAAKTMGMTDVACLAATIAAVADVTMTSTLRRTSSAAISSKRSVRPSAQRYSIATVRPSIQPSSRSRCTNAANHWPCDEGVPGTRNPMVGSFPACCAWAASGNAAAAPPSNLVKSRLFIDHLVIAAGHPPFAERVLSGGSLRLDVGRSDNLAPLLGIIGQEFPELHWRQWHRDVAEADDPSPNFGIGESSIDLAIKLLDYVFRGPS